MKLPATLLLLGMSVIAHAGQETTIVITPSGNLTPIDQVPGSITVITGEEIARRAHSSVAAALEGVPGITIVRSGPQGQITSIFARGSNSNHTLVMRDGMVLNDPSSPAGAFDLSNMSLNGVQRIEIVRGPLSTLYGSSAIGAVINIISKPGTLAPHHEIRLAAGSHGSFESAFSTSGSSGRLRYQLSLSHIRSEGQTAVMQLPAYGNTGQVPEDDGARNTEFNTRLTWHMSDESRLELGAFMKRARTDIDEFLIEDSDWTLGNREKSLQLQLFHRPADGDWGLQLGLRHNQTDRRSENPRQVPTENLIDTRYAGKHQSAETRISYYGLPGHELSLIAQWRRDRLTTSGFSAYGSVFGDFVVTEATDSSTSSNSLALQDQWNGVRGESVTASIRLDDHDRFGSHTSWRLAGSLPFFQRRGRLHLSAGSGFKAPSLYELFGESPNNYGSAYRGNPDLQPEMSRSIEAGVDYEFRAHAVTTGVTLYSTRIRDLIQVVYDPLFNSTSENLASAEIIGGEFYVAWRPLQNLAIRLDYSYTQARDRATQARLVRRPRHKTDLAMDYSLSDRLSVWAQLQHIGNRLDINPLFDPAAPIIRPDDYLLIHVGAGYRLTNDLELFGRINNLADERYEPVTGYRGEGINGIVGVKITL